MRIAGLGAALALVSIGFGACADQQSDADGVRSAVHALQTDMASGRVRAVCMRMTRRAKRQIGSVGHDRRPVACDFDLGAFLASDSNVDRALRAGRRPRVLDVAVDGSGHEARVLLSTGGKPFAFAFVKRNGAWKLDDFFGAAAPPIEELR